jgi:hypothetical protein
MTALRLLLLLVPPLTGFAVSSRQLAGSAAAICNDDESVIIRSGSSTAPSIKVDYDYEMEDAIARYNTYYEGKKPMLDEESPELPAVRARLRDFSCFLKDLQQLFTGWHNRTRPVGLTPC